MSDKLFSYLKYEQSLLGELIELAEKQQQSLVKFDTAMLQEAARQQLNLSQALREAEERRIKLISNWLGISRAEAQKLKLSNLESYFTGEELSEIVRLRKELKSLLNKLNSVNLTNRVLANRARRSVQEVLQIITNGGNHFYNVKV